MTYTLHHGDCLDVLPKLPAQSIDAVIADPPYGTTACKWDSVIPFEPMWSELKRVIKPRGAIVLFGSQPFTSALVMSNVKWFKYSWVWEKRLCSGFTAAKYRPLLAHEDVLVFGDGSITYNPQMTPRTENELKRFAKQSKVAPSPTQHALHLTRWRGTRETSTFRYPNTVIQVAGVNGASYEKQEGAHPTQKPLALLEYLVKTYTNEGDTVLDFTMGSGTTGHACINTNRNFIGIEKELNYFEIAQARLERAASTERQLEIAV